MEYKVYGTLFLILYILLCLTLAQGEKTIKQNTGIDLNSNDYRYGYTIYSKKP